MWGALWKMMLNYLVVDNLSTTIPGQIRDKKMIFNKFSDLYVVENQVAILREIGLIKSPIHYECDGRLFEKAAVAALVS